MKNWLKRVGAMLLVAVIVLMGIPLSASAHVNPIHPPEESEGFGDPFIMKYNGVYYMYGTLHASNSGTVVWSSTDLENWESHGTCMEGSNITGLYAPEVVYADGMFYMYTAPGGGGHIFYTSTSPTGPFKAATENLGLKFDGSVMRDSDNSLYFVTPSVGAIMGYYMKDNLTLDEGKGSFIIPASIAGAWTEGPTLFKRNGTYYTTYTGNHVWERSYRVEYALSKNPTTGWTEPADNTALLDIEGDINGLGHNSIFIGPDLDTYYIVYHNLYATPQPKSVRRYSNFDPIVWNGDKLCVLGPTAYETDNAKAPSFEERFADNDSQWTVNGSWNIADGNATATEGTLISKDKTKDVFTAEYNITSAAGATAEILFAYTDDNNYGRVWIDSSAKQLKAELIKDGASVWSDSNPLYDTFAYDALHTVKVQQTADALHIYLDNVDRIVYEATGLTGGSIGYRASGAEVTASYTAFSNKALGSNDGDNFMPVPGTIEAIHTNDNAENLEVVTASDGEMGYAVALKAGDKPTYNVNVKDEGTYSLSLYADNVAEGTEIDILVDGEKAATAKLSAIADGGYRALPIRNVKLPAGKRTITFEVKSGSLELYEIETEKTVEVTAVSTDCSTRFADDGATMWKQYEAMPTWANGELVYSDITTFGKMLTGELGWADYTVESDIMLTGVQKTAGFLFRVEHADNGIRDAVALKNPIYHQGYYLGLSITGLTLEKHNFGDSKTLATLDFPIEYNTAYKVKITAIDDTFTVEINGQQVLEYTDTSYPLLTGRAGIRTENATVKYDNFSVTPAQSGVAVTTFDVDYGEPLDYGEDATGGSSGNTGTVGGISTTIIIAVAAAAAVIVVGAVVVIIVLSKRKKGKSVVAAAPENNSDGETQ